MQDRRAPAPPSAEIDRPSRPSVALGSAIRRARAGRFTLAQLSQRAGVSSGLLSLIERGRGNPSINTLGAIADALGLSLPDLVAEAIRSDADRDALVVSLGPSQGSDVAAGALAPVTSDAVVEVDSARPTPSAWETSMVLQGGQEAHVRVLDGTLELTLRDRTSMGAARAGAESSLSVDLNLRTVSRGSTLEIPPSDDPRWGELARGEIPFEPTTLAAQMLFTHVVRCVRQDPSSPNVERWVRELRGFFVKYESVSTDDLAQVFGQIGGDR